MVVNEVLHPREVGTTLGRYVGMAVEVLDFGRAKQILLVAEDSSSLWLLRIRRLRGLPLIAILAI